MEEVVKAVWGPETERAMVFFVLLAIKWNGVEDGIGVEKLQMIVPTPPREQRVVTCRMHEALQRALSPGYEEHCEKSYRNPVRPYRDGCDCEDHRVVKRNSGDSPPIIDVPILPEVLSCH